MQNRTNVPISKLGALPALALALCLVLLLLQAGGCARTVRVGAQRVPLETTSLDLRGAGVTDVSPILELGALTALDLRDNEISAEDFETLRAALPDCEILWSVPIAGTRADSGSAELTLPAFSEADVPLLAYFPALLSVDASGSTDYAALSRAADAYTDCAFRWTVSIGGQSLLNDAETLDLSGEAVELEALSAAVEGLPMLKTVDLRGADLDASAIASLIAARPDVDFYADVELFGEHFDAGITEIDLSKTAAPDVDTLIEALGYFPVLERVNLRGCTLSGADRATLLAAYPELVFLWEVELLPGLTVDSETTELVVEGCDAPDVGTLIENLAYLPQLVKLDLCACYEPCDETNLEMDRLLAAYPEKKFVWLVMVGKWEIRTDIIAFSMGNQGVFDGGRYTGASGKAYAVYNDQILTLRYCTDLIALDMGHAKHITDVSCIAGLTKIRYLILGMMSLTSLEPLSGMTELEFLECYQNWISDLSPLLNCKKLKYLNCSTTFVETIDDIVQMTQLKRLWILRPQVLTKDDIAAIKAALPNTIVRSVMWAGGHSTIGGWRTKNPAYLHMQRDLFKLVLQDQKETEVGDPEYWDWDLEAFEAE